MVKLLQLNTNMTLKLRNVLYPNICGGDIGLILDFHIIGLITAANWKWKFVCVGHLHGFLYFYVTNMRLV
jgi:hypothetical protein